MTLLLGLLACLALSVATVAYLLFSPRAPTEGDSVAVSRTDDGRVVLSVHDPRRREIVIAFSPELAYQTGSLLCRGAASARREQSAGDGTEPLPVLNGAA